MNQPVVIAAAFGAGLAVLGLATGVVQLLGLRRLAGRRLVPSDEYAYLRGRYRRRLATAFVFVGVGGMIAGAYLSGMEARAAALAAADGPDADDPNAGKRELNPTQKQFVRIWGSYWIVVILLVFVLLALAVADGWATRRYWMGQYRQLKEDHQTRLRRDLEVYRQHRETTRGGRFRGG